MRIRIQELANVVSAVACCALITGCLLGGPHDRGPVSFEGAAPPASEGVPNWPVPADQAERMLRETPIEKIEVLDSRLAMGGTRGATRDTVLFLETGHNLTIKWKRFPPGALEGANNSPRRELAAYEIQKLFLDPPDYVVPTSVARCSPMEIVHRYDPDAEPSLEGATCELGLVSLWMSDVTLPDPLYDPGRFRSDRVYAGYMSDFNILTYLINHKDGRLGNFLVAAADDRRHVFSVDNGIAFDKAMGGLWFNWTVPNWNVIRIPALRKISVDRLQAVERDDLDGLGVQVQLEQGEDGMLRNVPHAANLDESLPVRIEGTIVQLGLKESEIDDVWNRLQRLLQDVGEGEIGTF